MAECATWTGEQFVGQVFEPAWWTDEDSPVVTSAQAAQLAG